MCLIFFSVNQHPRYKLIVAGNRDEFYNRRTAAADFWTDYPDILGGRDLEAMGTWLGMTRSGKISMLTNYRDPKNIDPKAPSRGQLVSDFLLFDGATEMYMNNLAATGKKYNGYNFIGGTIDELWYYSNYGAEPRQLGAGFYGLSNHLLDTPWPKVVKGKARLNEYLHERDPDPDFFFTALRDEHTAPDESLPDTGLPRDRERALSSMFIKTNGYGSRCSTVILVDRDNTVSFTERVYNTETFDYSTNQFAFKVSS
jgi:uncharacterized protein with NRDE domain